jgi:hypothetical protein
MEMLAYIPGTSGTCIAEVVELLEHFYTRYCMLAALVLMAQKEKVVLSRKV